MPGDDDLSADRLMLEELRGKAEALNRYDEIIWRIRTGYAVLLYGAVGVVAGLVNQKAIKLNFRAACAAIVLIIGFSLFGAVLDYTFMLAKLRVVKYRDRLIKLALLKATASSGSPDNASAIDTEELFDCLKISGERKACIDWSDTAGRFVPVVYYGGTGIVCSVATRLLAA